MLFAPHNSCFRVRPVTIYSCLLCRSTAHNLCAYLVTLKNISLQPTGVHVLAKKHVAPHGCMFNDCSGSHLSGTRRHYEAEEQKPCSSALIQRILSTKLKRCLSNILPVPAADPEGGQGGQGAWPGVGGGGGGGRGAGWETGGGERGWGRDSTAG